MLSEISSSIAEDISFNFFTLLLNDIYLAQCLLYLIRGGGAILLVKGGLKYTNYKHRHIKGGKTGT